LYFISEYWYWNGISSPLQWHKYAIVWIGRNFCFLDVWASWNCDFYSLLTVTWDWAYLWMGKELVPWFTLRFLPSQLPDFEWKDSFELSWKIKWSAVVHMACTTHKTAHQAQDQTKLSLLLPYVFSMNYKMF
jgi:hypothetical protein